MRLSFYSNILGVSSLLLSAGACKLQQRIRQTNSLEERQEQQFLLSDSAHLQWQEWRRTVSSETTGAVVIVLPEGVFQYSPEQGFRGSASRLIIKQQQVRKVEGVDSTYLQWQAQNKAQLQTTQRKFVMQEMKRSPLRMHWKVFMVCLLPLCIILFWWLKKNRVK